MKQFSFPQRIVEIQVKCPRDMTTHQAIVHAFYTPQNKPEVLRIDCHKSYECATCKQCLGAIALIYHCDEEPDFFESPLDPLSSPRWTEEGERRTHD